MKLNFLIQVLWQITVIDQDDDGCIIMVSLLIPALMLQKYPLQLSRLVSRLLLQLQPPPPNWAPAVLPDLPGIQ